MSKATGTEPEQIVFIGSSSEGNPAAHAVCSVLRRELAKKIAIRPWWHEDVFRAGDTFIESLEREVRRANAGVFVFTPDDPVSTRAQERLLPRDNVVFEYGLFVGMWGRPRVAVVQVGDAKLPSDLSGVTIIHVNDNGSEDALADEMRSKLVGWAERLRVAQPVLPDLTGLLAQLSPELKRWEAFKARRFDHTATQLVRSTYESVRTDNQGVNNLFAKAAETEARAAVSISAYDTTGPSGWIGPATYQYLAFQVREYLSRIERMANGVFSCTIGCRRR